MVKATMDIRIKAVVFYTQKTKPTKDICSMYSISERTLRRWARSYKEGGIKELKPKKTGPKKPTQSIPDKLEQRIIRLKQKHPTWGARRIKNQYNLSVHWKTVHNVIKRHGLLIRVKAKPQPCKRFQRKHVDSMWQGDTFQFRIAGVGKVYVTGFTDDCSRYRIRSKVYLRKGKEEAVNALLWALKKGRKPRQIYLDNGTQFISLVFKKKANDNGIKLIYGRPYSPRGRGKIERYHKALHQELIAVKTFTNLSHFKMELWKFDRKYNNWRKQEPLGWKTPVEIYNDEKYFNKENKSNKRTKIDATN